MSEARRKALFHQCPQHDRGLIHHDCTCWQKCSCELVEISTPAEAIAGEIRLVLGRSYGCPVHETEAERSAREEAERAEYVRGAKYLEAERKARSAADGPR